MTVKRYDFYYNDDFGAEYSAFQNEHADGEYVAHEDYAALLAERDALKEQVVNLAVENTSLNARTPFAYSYRYAGCETCSGFEDWRWELSKEKPPEWMLDTGKVTNLVELFECHVTPATDAALASIQAMGVDMFADECDSDSMLSEPEDTDHYVLMAEEAREFASKIRAIELNGGE